MLHKAPRSSNDNKFTRRDRNTTRIYGLTATLSLATLALVGAGVLLGRRSST